MVCVYDSGVGGLTALCAIRRCAPQCDVLYLADTARLPYGNRPREVLMGCARAALDLLASYAPSRILVACGTLSTVCLPLLAAHYPFPLCGVAEAGVRAAFAAAPQGEIAVLATRATVESGYFQARLARVRAVACPTLVPLAEGGEIALRDPMAQRVILRALGPLVESPPAAAILGCTHFGWLAEGIAAALPKTVLIDCAAAAVAECGGQLATLGGQGRTEYLVTADPEGFAAKATRLLGYPITARLVDIHC